MKTKSKDLKLKNMTKDKRKGIEGKMKQNPKSKIKTKANTKIHLNSK